MKKFFALIFLCLAAYSPAVLGEKEGALSINFTPEIFRLPQADNGDCMAELPITLSANNIQVREKWNVKSSSPFSINDNGVLAFNGATDQEAVITVIVEDEFSIVSNDYQNLTAQAIITLDIMVPKIFISGGADSLFKGATWSSGDGINWQINNANSFPARAYHTMSTLNGRLYAMGGYDSSSNFKDVWSRSRCGKTWQQDIAEADWGARAEHAVAVLQNTLFLAGGVSSNVAQNDIWSTTNGTNWSLVKANDETATVTVGWSKRQGHQMVSHQNTLYIIGGRSGDDIFGDVWSSPDGTNWSLLTDSTPWTNRYSHQVVVHNHQLYLMGGFERSSSGVLSDVWSSVDGTNWSLKANSMGGSRYGFVAFSYNGRLYVMGGNTNNEVWSSTDGKTWQQDTTNSGLLTRFGAAVAVFPPE